MYVINGAVSIKTDMFNFGVMLIEILGGKKNNSQFDLDRPHNLIGYVIFLYSYFLQFNIYYSNI